MTDLESEDVDSVFADLKMSDLNITDFKMSNMTLDSVMEDLKLVDVNMKDLKTADIKMADVKASGLVDEAINIAALFIKEKLQKKRKEKKLMKCLKVTKLTEDTVEEEESSLEVVLEEIERGKVSSLLKSDIGNRIDERRLRVWAVNETEKKLVKATIAQIKMLTSMRELSL